MLPDNDDDLLNVDIEQVPPEQRIDYRDALLRRWEARKAAIEKAEGDEDALRSKIIELCASPEVVKGNERVPLYNGYRLLITKGETVKVDKQTVNLCLDKLCETGDNGAEMAKRVIKWDPELSETQYGLLSEEQKAVMRTCITRKPSKIAIKIEAPKTSGGRATAKEGHEI